MTSGQYFPYTLGYKRATMAGTKGSKSRDGANPIKTGPSSDCRLKLACMKLESLVTVGQHTTVNTFPGLVHTARQTMKVTNTRSPIRRPKVGEMIGVKS
jgi:hypothetical protein